MNSLSIQFNERDANSLKTEAHTLPLYSLSTWPQVSRVPHSWVSDAWERQMRKMMVTETDKCGKSWWGAGWAARAVGRGVCVCVCVCVCARGLGGSAQKWAKVL